MAKCAICGSRFADKRCYFCQNRICTSCVVPPDVSGSSVTVKCLQCHRRNVNKISMLAVLKRNKAIIGIVAGFWVFTVYPIPFLQMMGYHIDASAFQPVFFATAAMTIPFVFMFIAWQKKAPRGS